MERLAELGQRIFHHETWQTDQIMKRFNAFAGDASLTSCFVVGLTDLHGFDFDPEVWAAKRRLIASLKHPKFYIEIAEDAENDTEAIVRRLYGIPDNAQVIKWEKPKLVERGKELAREYQKAQSAARLATEETKEALEQAEEVARAAFLENAAERNGPLNDHIKQGLENRTDETIVIITGAFHLKRNPELLQLLTNIPFLFLEPKRGFELPEGFI